MFHVCLYYSILPVPCSLLIIVIPGKGLAYPALLRVIFRVLCHFPLWCLGSGVVLYLSIPDLCIFFTFLRRNIINKIFVTFAVEYNACDAVKPVKPSSKIFY